MTSRPVKLGRTYLIAAAGRPAGVAEAIGSIRQVTVRRGDRPAGAVTPLFTNRARAARVVAKLPDAAALRVLGVRNPRALAVVLGHLIDQGEAHVLLDPDSTRPGRLVAAAKLIKAIARRRTR